MQTVSAIVSGKVQGVYFRQSAVEQANALGITGRVMNLQDGRVKLIVSGSPEQLNAFLSWCQRGPAGANVDSVHFEYIDFREFKGFSIDR